MKEDKLQKEIISLDKDIGSLDKEINKLSKELDTKKEKRNSKYRSLMHSKYPTYVGRCFLTMIRSPQDCDTKLYVYIHVIQIVEDAFEIEKFWIDPVLSYGKYKFDKFIFEKNFYPCYWLHEKMEISKEEYEKKKKELMKKAGLIS